MSDVSHGSFHKATKEKNKAKFSSYANSCAKQKVLFLVYIAMFRLFNDMFTGGKWKLFTSWLRKTDIMHFGNVGKQKRRGMGWIETKCHLLIAGLCHIYTRCVNSKGNVSNTSDN